MNAGAVQIGVLGPFELRVGGAVVPVAAGERALLARLASSTGRVVLVERLIDDLWEADLPADPRNALQLRVSKLRKILGGAMVRDGAGYRLALPDEAVDATSFRRLVAERRYDDALALWRGIPYEDFADRAWARAESAALVELRASALEERMSRRLEAGDGASLVPDLVALVAAQPLRERMRAQLMQALHRSGRTADALAAYREYRSLLRDELGLAPSPALRKLEESILRDDVSLQDPSEVAVGRSNLPAPLTRLIGREVETGRVSDLLEQSRLVTLVGPGGAGKTSLAVAVAGRIADRYPDGLWWVPLGNIGAGSQLPTAVADAIGLSDPEARSVRSLLAAWLAPRRALLVLDNCEHLVDDCAQLTHDLLAVAPALEVLATSREPLGIPGEVQLRVPPLQADDAVELFAERARAVRPDFALDRVRDAVRSIVDRLDGMPLAVELAAARVNAMTPSEIAARLDDRFALLTRGPRTAEARHRTLRAVVDWSYDLIGEDERSLLRRLSVFRGGWTRPAAVAVSGMEEGAVLDLLSSLVDRSLLNADGERFTMLETIRAYAEARLADSDGYRDARERHARYHAKLAELAERGLRGTDQAKWLALLRAEDANLRLALEWAREESDDPDLAFRLAGALGWYWYVGRQMDGATQLRLVLEAPRPASAGVRARALQALSLAVRPAGCIVHPSEEAAAAAQESLALFGADEPDRAALSRLLVAVQGVAAHEAEPHLAEVARGRAALASHDDPWGVALADFIEMEIRLHRGAVDEALPFGRRAAAAFDHLGDQWGRSAVRLHLGHGLRLAGRVEEAEDVLALAVQISRDTGLPNNLARSQVELGETALQRGDPDEAVARFDDAEGIAAEVGSETLRALALLGRGGVARWRGDAGAARRHFREALDLSVGAGVPRGEARARLGLAAVALDDGDAAGAAEHLERATRIARRIGDPSAQASALEQSARAAAAGDAAGRARLIEDADRLRARQGRPRGALEHRDVLGVTRSISRSRR
jgi:predicted ATPase/DNA-binding SARP family transcriptional activator